MSRGAWDLEGEVAGPGAVARKPGPGGMSQAPRAPPKAERGARRPVPLTVRGTDRRRGRAIPCQRCSSLPPTLILTYSESFKLTSCVKRRRSHHHGTIVFTYGVTVNRNSAASLEISACASGSLLTSGSRRWVCSLHSAAFSKRPRSHNHTVCGLFLLVSFLSWPSSSFSFSTE